MFDRRTYQRVDQLFEDQLARNRLRYGDHSREVEVLGHCAGRSSRGLFSSRLSIPLSDDLLQQCPHIEVDARSGNLPLRRVILVNAATGQLDGSPACRVAGEWALVLGFK